MKDKIYFLGPNFIKVKEKRFLKCLVVLPLSPQFRVLSSLREQEIIYIHKGLVGTL